MNENESNTEIAKDQGKYKGYDNLKPHQFKPGQSGNPGGKPKGTVSLKEFAKRYLQTLTDEEKIEYMRGLDKDVVWKMAEGNPKNDLDLNAKVSIADVIKDIENDEPRSEIAGQIVETVAVIQDQGQEEKPNQVQAEQSPSPLQPAQVEQEHNPEV